MAKEHRAINRVMANLNEKNRRRFAGVLAMQWGQGGVQRVMAITGLSRNTIGRGRSEVQRGEGATRHDRVRASGAGRPAAEKSILAS